MSSDLLSPYILFILSGIDLVDPLYDIGYQYGCQDAVVLNPMDRYINQPDEWYLFKLDQFIQGYHQGHDKCTNMDQNILKNLNKNNLWDSSPGIIINFPVFVLTKIFIFLSNSYFIISFIILFLILLLISLYSKVTKRSTKKIRKNFSIQIKESILKKQKYRCAICRMQLKVIDFDHKNGNRSDNRIRNCQALCPNCHALKSRRENSIR